MTTARTARGTPDARTSDCWLKRELRCHLGLKTLQRDFGRGDWIRTSDPLRPRAFLR